MRQKSPEQVPRLPWPPSSTNWPQPYLTSGVTLHFFSYHTSVFLQPRKWPVVTAGHYLSLHLFSKQFPIQHRLSPNFTYEHKGYCIEQNYSFAFKLPFFFFLSFGKPFLLSSSAYEKWYWHTPAKAWQNWQSNIEIQITDSTKMQVNSYFCHEKNLKLWGFCCCIYIFLNMQHIS